MPEMTDRLVQQVQGLVPFVNTLADRARPASLAHFRSPALTVETKDDLSPVTRADRETEAALRDLITTRFPDHGIFGEEAGQTGMDREFVWVLDPIDGTRAFVCGLPLWGTLIALAWRGQPVLGVLDAPALGERWVGCLGLPTTHDGRPCRARALASLDQARLFSTSPDLFAGEEQRRFEALSARVAERRFGGDCYNYGLLASGWIDVVAETDMKPYDYMALVPVVEGAGGRMSDWQGRPLRLDTPGTILASGDGAGHAAALDALGGA
ncbi:histidinol-phosphatase [Roseospira visakhapatnamensis]|uniref:Histidinol-phosphatase n=1 Tax=Roseospira visakhapatnamensis TaxID=390880 RepID=A0A7W6RB68_9PROT|nr:histidinol-phosphatase [Roseospira visakhapatnamensis]MBB4265200.1 histidinol phosphatase-like enzyme (inositol monophosphatase family) [Roseospira visakhapatnamensis]